MIHLFRPPQWIDRFYPSYTWRLAVSGKTVFLTFDDGPHPEITPFVLKELAKRNMYATFFCVGENVKQYPEIARAVLEAGHSIGNHTMRHTNGMKASNSDYFQSAEDFRQVATTHLFRPPYGKMKYSQRKELRKQFQLIMWSWLSYDFDRSVSIERIMKKARTIKPGDILVLHDNPKIKERQMALLPQLLDYLKENGFTSAAIPASPLVS